MKEELIKQLEKNFYEGLDRIKPHIVGHMTATNLIVNSFQEAIQSLSQSEWISVDDRLPELVGNKYLIYCGKEYKIAEYLGGNFWDDDLGNIKDSQVTHWTPIFKAPQTK